MAGWQKVYRDIQKHWLWEDKPFSRGQAFIDLILAANHQDRKIMVDGELTEVFRGSQITSLRKLGEAWGWSSKKVKKFLEQLQKDEMITYKSDNKKTVVTIENYSLYQDTGNTEETERKQQGNSEETQRKFRGNSEEIQKHTNKKDKEYINNDEEGEEWEETPSSKPLSYSFPTEYHKSIFSEVSEVTYKTWFMNTRITEEDKSLKIEVMNDLIKDVIIKRNLDTLKTIFNKEIIVEVKEGDNDNQ